MKSPYSLAATLAAFAALSALVACAPSSRSGGIVTRISGAKIVASDLSATDKAEELAKGAEELFSAQGFAESAKMADLALAQDPKNLRAGLFRVLTRPILLQRGAFTRVRPLVAKIPQGIARLDETLGNAKPEEREFLAADGAVIEDERALQAHLDETIRAADELRDFAKANRDSEISLRATNFIMPDAIDRYADACELKTVGDYDYELVCPDKQARFYLTLNRADWEMVRGMASYMKILLSLSTAYDLDQSSTIVSELLNDEASGTKQSPEELSKKVLALPNAGKLRAQSRLKETSGMFLDVIAAVNWASANQESLCPTGRGSAVNRPGKLLNTGLCLGGVGVNQQIDYLLAAVRGEPQDADVGGSGGSFKTQVRYFQIFNDPIKDIRQLGPFTFDACGQVTSVGEPTLNGMFPNGDFNQVLFTGNEKCAR